MVFAAAVWWLRQPIHEYLLSRPDHPPGAADVLATVVHHASPLERAHRRVLACAREGNAHGCMEAFWNALTTDPSKDQSKIVSSWLNEKEVQVLRVNAYFDQFASDMEQHPDRVRPPVALPKSTAWFSVRDTGKQPAPPMP